MTYENVVACDDSCDTVSITSNDSSCDKCDDSCHKFINVTCDISCCGQYMWFLHDYTF